ncbi:MAG: site-specific DNA-methyltransferase [Deltaproteobacteria bacterium]|nr:site-specific DNA-methyltransferase [Deltaproteobacteria bacterium]
MIDENTICHGDATEFLRTLPDRYADVIIADPPYSLKKDREFGEGAFLENREAWLAWCKQWLIEAKRILKPTGNLFVYAIHHNACFLQTYMYEIGLRYRRQIIWYYENGWSKYKNGPACHYEPILWFAHREDSTFHVIREPYKSQERLRHTITKNGKIWTPHPNGRQAGDVWHIPTLAGRRFAKERTEHPTQKPLALSRRLVEHFSNPSAVLVVPFVGSGSECVAAIECGRRFVGAEINPTYVEIARSRIARASVQLFQVDAKNANG